MARTLKLAAAQTHTLATTAATLEQLRATALRAAQHGVDLLLFPEAYLGGYPRTCNFGSVIGSRTSEGREQFLQYFHSAVDLGDTPAGSDDAWLERKLPIAKGQKHRGDGTREELESIARDSGVFIVTGLIERSGGSLYCSVVYVCPKLGTLGKRRKVMPTGLERLCWSQGDPKSLKAVTTVIKNVKLVMAAAICWENLMPLLRQSLYAQNVNLYLAPTADGRKTWAPLMQTAGMEGRCFVVSANQCMKRKDLPEWITRNYSHSSATKSFQAGGRTVVNGHSTRRRSSILTKTEEGHEINWPCTSQGADSSVDEEALISEGPPSAVKATNAKSDLTPQAQADGDDPEEILCRGGSCIVSPSGELLRGPLWDEDDDLVIVEADFEDCERGRLDLDVAGSYSRMDAFHLSVTGLDLNPPP